MSMLFSFLRKHWKLFILGGVIFTVVIVFRFSSFFSSQNGYVFDTVKKMTVTEVVSDAGKIVSKGSIDVYSPTNGIMQDVYVKNGQEVTEDETLFTVKSSASVQEQQTALANYQAAVAAQNSAETLLHTYRSNMYTQWKTYTDMATNSTYESSKGVPNEQARKAAEFQSTQDNWLAAEKQFIDQEQAVTAAQAQVSAAWTTYLATQTADVPSPVNGSVRNLAVSSGMSVKALTALTPNAAPVLSVTNSEDMEAVLTVGQTDIAKVKEGQDATIHPDAYKDQSYSGKVVRLDTLGQDNQGVIEYNVYIALSKANSLLLPGMTIDGDITTNIKEQALTVPNSAIVIENNQKAVRILKNNRLIFVPVVVGIRGQTRTQIISGLSQGQQVIVALTNEKAARSGFLGL